MSATMMSVLVGVAGEIRISGGVSCDITAEETNADAITAFTTRYITPQPALLALANLNTSVIQSPLRHSQSGEAAVGWWELTHASQGAQVLIESRNACSSREGWSKSGVLDRVVAQLQHASPSGMRIPPSAYQILGG